MTVAPFTNVKSSRSKTFFHKKVPVLESLFTKVALLQAIIKK